MLPDIEYERIVSGQKDKGYEKLVVPFDAKGNFEIIPKIPPPSYGQVPYWNIHFARLIFYR